MYRLTAYANLSSLMEYTILFHIMRIVLCTDQRPRRSGQTYIVKKEIGRNVAGCDGRQARIALLVQQFGVKSEHSSNDTAADAD